MVETVVLVSMGKWPNSEWEEVHMAGDATHMAVSLCCCAPREDDLWELLLTARQSPQAWGTLQSKVWAALAQEGDLKCWITLSPKRQNCPHMVEFLQLGPWGLGSVGCSLGSSQAAPHGLADVFSLAEETLAFLCPSLAIQPSNTVTPYQNTPKCSRRKIVTPNTLTGWS